MLCHGACCNTEHGQRNYVHKPHEGYGPHGENSLREVLSIMCSLAMKLQVASQGSSDQEREENN